MLIYVLSIGPVNFCIALRNPITLYHFGEPTGVARAYAPLWQAIEKTPLETPLRAYLGWWEGKAWKINAPPIIF